MKTAIYSVGGVNGLCLQIETAWRDDGTRRIWRTAADGQSLEVGRLERRVEFSSTTDARTCTRYYAVLGSRRSPGQRRVGDAIAYVLQLAHPN